MRLIDADVLTEKYGDWYTEEGCEEGYIGTVRGIVDSMPTVQTERRWIPCSESLPEEDTDVLVSVHFLGLKQTSPRRWNGHIRESWYVDVARMIGDEWSSASDEFKVAKDRHKIIAWMPLPEPYREDGEA